jgi:hypothetical protein
MKRVLIALISLTVVAPVLAQAQAGPTSRFGWSQVATDLPSASGFTYRAYLDASATGTTLTATCTGTASPFSCTAPIPAVTPGTHTVALTAANVAGESLKSSVTTFQMVAVPSAPTSIVILP